MSTLALKLKSSLSPSMRELLSFLGLGALFYALYHFGYEVYLQRTNDFDFAFDDIIAAQAAYVFRLFGHPSVVLDYPPYRTLLLLDTHPAVGVAPSCNGLPMLYLFAAFIFAHPGPIMRKLWFVPLGLVIIHASNVLRIMALAVVSVYHREYFEVNHKYVYAIVVYSLIFGLFALWHFYLSDPSKPVFFKQRTSNNKAQA